jgi:ABC-type oligopeptide transport system substrate-binding subunit
MSIDKAKLAQLRPGWTVASTFVPEGMRLGYSPKPGLQFNPAKAKEILKAAGFDPGKKLITEILARDDPQYIQAAQFIALELKRNLGMEVAIRPYDYKSFYTELYGKTHPLFVSAWTADYPDPDNFLSVFLSGGGHNPTKWSDPRFDAAVMRARKIPDPMSRDEIYFEMQKLLLEQEAVVIPLYYDNQLALVQARVRGLELNPLNMLILRKVDLD